MSPLIARSLAWSGAALALLGTWVLYTQPHFMVQMADMVWSCF